MTKTEAAAILGLVDDASLADVRRRYESLHNDYQIRLTNAPTSALKKTYQQKLQELSSACDVLHPGFSSGTTGGDLPSAEPLIAEGHVRPSYGSNVSGSRTSARSNPRGDLFPRSAPAVSKGLPASTIIAGAAAVIFAAALSFVVLRWSQTSTQLAQLEGERDKLAEAAATLKARIDASDRLLYTDRLRIRNLSKNTVRISAAAFVYRDQSGALKLAHSGNYDYPAWDIRAGGITPLDAEMKRGSLWDGPVLYYALLIEYPGVESFLKAGVWAEDIDRLDKVVTLDLD